MAGIESQDISVTICDTRNKELVDSLSDTYVGSTDYYQFVQWSDGTLEPEGGEVLE